MRFILILLLCLPAWGGFFGGGGSGDVAGPASSTDNELARFDSTTGKLLQGSGVYVDDSQNLTTATTLLGIKQALRVYDSAGTDYIEISHNGSDVITDFANTEEWHVTKNISIFSVGEEGDVDNSVRGSLFRVRRNAAEGDGYMQMYLDDTGRPILNFAGLQDGYISTGGNFDLNVQPTANREFVVNDSKANIDFRVESSGLTHNLFSDGELNAIGIGGAPGNANTTDGALQLSSNGLGITAGSTHPSVPVSNDKWRLYIVDGTTTDIEEEVFTQFLDSESATAFTRHLGRQVRMKKVTETVADAAGNDVMQNDDHLLFSVIASAKYVFELVLIYNAPAAADLDFQFTVPSGGTLYMDGTFTSTGVAPIGAATEVTLNGTGAVAMARYHGVFVNSTTAGVVQLQWASNVANQGALTVNLGSYIEFRKAL